MGQVGLHCATANSYGNICPRATPLSPSMTSWLLCYHNHHHLHLLSHESNNPAALGYGSWASTSPSTGCALNCWYAVTGGWYAPSNSPSACTWNPWYRPSWGTNLQTPLCAGRLIFHNPSDADSSITPQYPWSVRTGHSCISFDPSYAPLPQQIEHSSPTGLFCM